MFHSSDTELLKRKFVKLMIIDSAFYGTQVPLRCPSVYQHPCLGCFSRGSLFIQSAEKKLDTEEEH